MATDVVQKVKPSGNFNLGVVLGATPVGNYQTQTDLVLAAAIETKISTDLNVRFNNVTYYGG